MTVSDLAEELGLPASAVLEQCKRAGIDAGWAGAELSGSDVVVLRAELASADAPLDLTPADEASAEATSGADGVAGPTPSADAPAAAPPSPPVPPTAVGSAPEAAGGPEVPPTVPGPTVPANASTVASSSRQRETVRRLDKAVRGGIAALVVAVVALVVGEVVPNPWVIWAMWLVAFLAALVALWNGNAGRRHVTTHPERYKGLGLAVGTMVLAVGIGIGVVASVLAAIGDDPAADAPLGDRSSVAEARWGYQRLTRIADEGWRRPAKDAGTCWVIDDDVERDNDRIEVGTDLVECEREHTVQIIEVFAVDRTADEPYPGQDALQQLAKERCEDQVAKLLDPEEDGQPISGVLFGEIPTEDGWKDADRDVACAVVTPSREGALD